MVTQSRENGENSGAQASSTYSSVEDETKDRAFHWDHYKSQLSKEDSEVFDEYISVLDDESKFFCFDWCDQEHTFSGYLDSIMAGDNPDIEGIAWQRR